MEPVSLSAAGKLIMILLCLCGMPEDKDKLWVDVISQEGVIESVVARPTTDGYALFENDMELAEKLIDIHRDGSLTSFTMSDDKRKIDLKAVFPATDFEDFSTATSVELKNADGETFKFRRSGGTVYVTGPTGLTFSIHK